MAHDQCVSCHDAEAKYKCPQCSSRTCSVACSKQHKETHPTQDPTASHARTDAETSPRDANADPDAGAAAVGTTGKPQKANQLADMPEYQMLMKRYPQLLTQLSGIAAATDPPPSPSSLPDPVAAAAASARYTGKKQEPWTPDIGIQKGMEVLKSARQARGADSEGIREFIELYRMWQARQAEEKRGQQAGASQADLQVINELLQKEKASVR
ncbi:zinc finger HIT domain-containing protein 3 [Microdochium nivale]|nr:zinc finger HIT domain-containing protein 3 [Microdochium nivale]